MASETLGPDKLSLSGEIQQIRLVLGEKLVEITEHGTSIVNSAWGLIYNSPLVNAVREEIEEINFDLHQKSGSPPISLKDREIN